MFYWLYTSNNSTHSKSLHRNLKIISYAELRILHNHQQTNVGIMLENLI